MPGDVIIYRPELAKAAFLSDILTADKSEYNTLKITTKKYREEGSQVYRLLSI
jgi:hypothetical protein